MKNESKFGHQLACRFKIDMRNLINLEFNGSFLTKVCNV